MDCLTFQLLTERFILWDKGAVVLYPNTTTALTMQLFWMDTHFPLLRIGRRSKLQVVGIYVKFSISDSTSSFSTESEFRKMQAYLGLDTYSVRWWYFSHIVASIMVRYGGVKSIHAGDTDSTGWWYIGICIYRCMMYRNTCLEWCSDVIRIGRYALVEWWYLFGLTCCTVVTHVWFDIS